MSTTTAKLLVNAAYTAEHVFWIDDVWVTGLLSHSAGIELESLNPLYTVYVEHLKCCLGEENVVCDFAVGPSSNDVGLIRDFAKNVKNCAEASKRQKPCKRRTFSTSVLQNCPIKNPLFLPDTKVIGEVII